MRVLIANANPADEEFFSEALSSLNLTFLDKDAASIGDSIADMSEIEVVSLMHGNPFVATNFDRFPGLRLISTRSTGFDHIDLAAAKHRGVTVVNVPEYGSVTVAEFTMGLILSISRRISQAVSQSREGKFSADGLMGNDLSGKTLGIVGLGKIGQNVAKMAAAFDMKVIAHDPFKPNSVPMSELLTTSDFVALCCPLTAENHHLISATELKSMKNCVYLINTARGPLVDSVSLLDALNAKVIAGAALDVLDGEEALKTDLPNANREANLALMGHPRAIVTPHLAYDSVEALQRIRECTAETILAFQSGKLINSING
jgi:D-lactate dehydrogenase